MQQIFGIDLKVTVTAAAICGALCFIYIWQRTASGHSLLTWLWKRFSGTTGSTVSAITNKLEERDAVHRFRYVTGIKATTLRETQSVINFSDTHNIDVSEIAKCGHYFNFECSRITLTPNWLNSFFFFAGCALLLCMAGAAATLAGLVVTDRYILLSPVDKRWVALGEETIFDFNGKSFSLADCALDELALEKQSGFATKEISQLCEKVKTGKMKKYVTDGIYYQRIFAFIFLVPTAIYGLWLSTEILYFIGAISLQRKIYNRCHNRMPP